MMFGAFFFFIIMSCIQAEKEQLNVQEKVISAENAENGEFPYQVSISVFNQHVCAGAIITNTHVLTAAHCVDIYKEEPFKLKVAVGSLKLSWQLLIYYANKIIIHNFFNRTTGENDIAIVKVRTPFIFSGLVNSVRLPNSNYTLNVNQIVIVSGWSRIYFNGYVSNNLQRAELFIRSYKSCRTIYNSKATAKFLFLSFHKKPDVCMCKGPYNVKNSIHFCASDPDVKRGNCQFDSGSTLTINGTLVGLMSWGDPRYCGGTDFPIVCTKVSNYINWINEQILISPQ